MRNKIQTRWVHLLFGVVFCLLAAKLQAATVTVTTASDELNGNTGSIAALIGSPGGAGISLREAIIAANNTAGADVIQFAAALNGVPITLTRVGDDNTGSNGDLDIRSSITITGNGAANTIIQGSTGATFTGSMGDKGFAVNPDGDALGLTVSFSDLTIRWCRNSNTVNALFTHTGGGVDVFLTGTGNSTTFTNVTITGNESVNGWGGGLNVDSGTVGAPGDVGTNTANRGTVTLTNCTVTNNKTANSSGSPNSGAGINLFSDIHNVTLTNCTVTGNQSLDAEGNGGGVNIRHTYGGTVNISGGTYSNNTTAGIGGGIYVGGNQLFSLSNATIEGNSSTNTDARGGGVVIANLGVQGFTGTNSLTGVTISNNHADNGTSEGGGLFFTSAHGATLTNCSITGNTAKTGAGVHNAGGTTPPNVLAISGGSITNNIAAAAGGGMSHVGTITTTTLTNCPVTGNTAATHGGGIYITNGTVTLDGETISNNTADNDYQPLAAGTVNFTAGGAMNQTVTVTVNGDLKVELNETVEISLSTPVNGSILDGSGTGTITNDDNAVVSISNPSVAEGSTGTATMTFNVTLNNPSDANVTVNYTTVDGTATIANNDYATASGSVTFTPGQTAKTVNVTVNGDCAIEPDETLLLRLSGLVNNGRNVTLSGGGATLDGTGTIQNEDNALTINSVTVTQPTCAVPAGSISVNATGSGTLEYSKDNGSNWQTSNTFSGLAPGSSHQIAVRSQANPACVTVYGSNPVTINAVPPPPTVFNVGGGGTLCSSGGGNAPSTSVTLSGSQTGVTYQLKRDGNNVGSPLNGTGAALSFTNLSTAGTYTIVANNAATVCTSTMNGNAVITVGTTPTLFSVTGGGSYCAGGAGVAVGLSGSQTGVNYQLKRSNVNVGSPVAGTGAAISFGNQTVAGTYTVVAVQASSGCERNMSGSKSVTVNNCTTREGVEVLSSDNETVDITDWAVIAPNPVAGQRLILQIKAPAQTRVEWQLIDTQGMTSYHSEFTTLSPVHRQEINTGRLPAGSYVLRVRADERKTLLKFIKPE